MKFFLVARWQQLFKPRKGAACVGFWFSAMATACFHRDDTYDRMVVQLVERSDKEHRGRWLFAKEWR